MARPWISTAVVRLDGIFAKGIRHVCLRVSERVGRRIQIHARKRCDELRRIRKGTRGVIRLRDAHGMYVDLNTAQASHDMKREEEGSGIGRRVRDKGLSSRGFGMTFG